MTEYICPHCKNVINDDEALLCLFCGESLGRHSSGAIGAMRAMLTKDVTSEGMPRLTGRGAWKWIFVMIAGIIILSFLFSIG